jgi:putative thioredoxin
MDVTDATFQTAVLERSATVPVIVDLWAEWCGPCKTLGPMLEQAINATNGAVELAKVDVDANPKVAQSFAVQSIPAVFAIKDAKVVDQFVGAVPQAQINAFIAKLAPPPSEVDQLVAAGDEPSLRHALQLDPGHAPATEALARMLIDRKDAAEALTLLGTIPETANSRALAAEARLLQGGVDVHASGDADVEARLQALLERVRDDEAARQEYIDVLETLGPENPRTNEFRRALAARLF